MDWKAEGAAAQQMYGTEAPRNSPFDSLANVVSFLREIDAMADKVASRIVGADMKVSGKYSGETSAGIAVAAVPNLIERLESSNASLREIGESIARHLQRIESRL